MKVPNARCTSGDGGLSLLRLQNEGSQLLIQPLEDRAKSIKAGTNCFRHLSLSRLQNEGSQRVKRSLLKRGKSIKATE